MKNKTEKSRKGKMKMGWIIALSIVGVLAIGGGIGWSRLKMEHAEAKNVTIENIDFKNLQDGKYTGEYEGGMFKWRQNSVKVTVESGKVTDIELLNIGAKFDKTQELYDEVLENQSLQVDVISGATLTCKGLLKGLENALQKAEK